MRSLLALSALLAAAPALAEGPGDPARGREIVTTFCEACHVAPAGADRSERAPPGSLPFPEGVPLPLKDVANTSGVTATALRAWLASDHPNMPDFVLSEREVEDVVAYILSLREQAL